MAKEFVPRIEIDWNRVDELLIAGCKGSEIAAHLGCSDDTLYERTVIEKGMLYSTYSAKMKAKGDSILREAQLKNALGGNTTMQIWLGKQRLDQSERTTTTISNPMIAVVQNVDGKTEELVGRKSE